MRKYSWIVMSDCDPDQEDAFNRWYDDVHLPDLLRIPGIVDARRLDLAPFQSITDPETGALAVSDAGRQPGQFPYLAVYDFETDDVQAVLDEVVRRAGTPDMVISEHLRDVSTHLYERR